MNIEEFLVELEKTKDHFKWGIYDQKIRGILKNQVFWGRLCPIVAVGSTTGKWFYPEEHWGAVFRLEINFDDASQIMDAADFSDKEQDLRKRILQILDLNEARAQRA